VIQLTGALFPVEKVAVRSGYWVHMKIRRRFFEVHYRADVPSTGLEVHLCGLPIISNEYLGRGEEDFVLGLVFQRAATDDDFPTYQRLGVFTLYLHNRDVRDAVTAYLKFPHLETICLV
jgi:hypothetical protein